MKKRIVLLLLTFLLSAVVHAVDVQQNADRLNFYDIKNHTVTITNNCGVDAQLNITLPVGFTFVSGAGCTNTTSLISCDVGTTASYTVQSPGSSVSEYTTALFPVAAINASCSANNVTFLRIKDQELAHTLVEYGRGRGNYFFDSMFTNTSGSGHTGIGCPYVPNSTLFELNFLHKILNVKQYFGTLTANAYNATFSCSYPNRTIVRTHLNTGVTTNTTGVFIDYRIPKIEGSWERMGFLSMDFREDKQFFGESLTINCTNITYSFPFAGGNMLVEEDSFTLEVRNKEPFSAAASSASTVGNGTQEVLITYNITNTELYTVDNVILEIKSPEFATFIGTRSELWGTSQETYRIEKTQLRPGESVVISLIARFDTATALPSLSSLNLTREVRAQYTTCWESNAYNPTEYTQILSGIGVIPANMSISSQIVDIRRQIDSLYNITISINNTLIQINTTLNNIQTLVQIINTTTQDTNIIVKQINTTSNQILNQTTIILDNTNAILNETNTVMDLLTCNNDTDSLLCQKVAILNQTVFNLLNLTLQVNNTANNLNITIIEDINLSGINVTANIDLSGLQSDLLEVKNLINCTAIETQSNGSVCNRLDRIENLTLGLNTSITTILNTTLFINNTIFGNYTFQDILNAITNVTVDTSEVLSGLQELKEFDEEIIFLVTDSFGLQQQAKSEFLRGDIQSTSLSLRSANDKLLEAADQILASRDAIISEQSTGSFKWVLIALIIITVITVFLFQKVPGGRQ